MGYHRGTVLAKDEYFPMWSGAAWGYYRYSRSRVAHLFSVIPPSMDYAKSFCGQIVSIPLLEREESAKTLCKVCLRNNRKHETDELERARRAEETQRAKKEFYHEEHALEADNQRLRAALENVLLAIDHEDYYNDAVFDEAREALKLAGKEGE